MSSLDGFSGGRYAAGEGNDDEYPENSVHSLRQIASYLSAFVWEKSAREARLHHCPKNFLLLTTLATALFSATAFCQTICCQVMTFGLETPANADPAPNFNAVRNFNVSAFRAETFDFDNDTTGN